MSPKLSETRGAVGRYVTLTHRWTKLTESSATTFANYESRKQLVDMTTLSLTFQDAFEIVHKLGVQYIWIDALCIIQDSSEDWEREASNMRSIYEFAWLNIAVAGSETEDGRIFMERYPRLSRPCKLPDSLLSGYIAEFDGPVYAYLSSQCYAKAVFDGFLTRRGWILQERILSPRTVYFGREEIFWECSSITASETIPWGWEDHETSIVKFNGYDLALNASGLLENDTSPHQKIKELGWRTPGTFDESQTNKSLSPLYRYWYRLVEAYTCKDLTRAADRLPAINGLAQALHKSGIPYKPFSVCYQSGVWLSEPTSLLWFLDSSPEVDGSVNTAAPSYSWGSWSDAAVFMAHEVDFIASSQLTQISDSLNCSLLSRPERSITTNTLQIFGEFVIAQMEIEKVKWVDRPINSTIKRQKLPKTETLQVSISVPPVDLYSNSFHTILDKYPEDSLIDWLKLSNGTVWLLKLAIGKPYELNSNWLYNVDTGYGDSGVHKLYDFGLILIPSHEDIVAVKEIQGKLEPWNFPATSTSMPSRESSPPINENSMHTHAKDRLEAYKLMGPHNTVFRRVGIYRTRASYWRDKKFSASVLVS